MSVLDGAAKYLKHVSGEIGSSNSLVFGQEVEEEVRKVQEKGGPIQNYLRKRKPKLPSMLLKMGFPEL